MHRPVGLVNLASTWDYVGSMDIISQGINDYLMKLCTGCDVVLREMEERARRENFPIVGPMVGRILYQLAKISRARKVLDLGSGFGYSAYWFGLALGERDALTLTECARENIRLARDYFERGRIRCELHFHQGDALKILEKLKGPFDIIFNDIDKDQYPKVFHMVAPRLRQGGLFICDNVLWHGQVVEPNPDPSTRGIVEHNRLIFESGTFFSSIIPVRDGLSVSVKE